jgi:hypothetical protein
MCWTASPASRYIEEGTAPAKAEVPPGSYPPSVNLSADEVFYPQYVGPTY